MTCKTPNAMKISDVMILVRAKMQQKLATSSNSIQKMTCKTLNARKILITHYRTARKYPMQQISLVHSRGPRSGSDDFAFHAYVIHAYAFHAYAFHAYAFHAYAIHAYAFHAYVFHAYTIHAYVFHAYAFLAYAFHA